MLIFRLNRGNRYILSILYQFRISLFMVTPYLEVTGSPVLTTRLKTKLARDFARA